MQSVFNSKEEVHNRAKEIIGIPFEDLKKNNDNVKNKNTVGDIFESWFGKTKDSASEPDLGVAELKATPYRKLKSGKYSAKERLVFNIINYMDIVNEDFENSHFLFKNKVIELGFYEYLQDKPKNEWTFSDVALYEMSKNPEDFAIIKSDWKKIQKYVVDGRAGDINEGMTDYLAACTKGKNSSSMREQPFNSDRAKQRAFSLKSGYMTQLLRNYILGESKNEFLIKDYLVLNEKSLDEIIKEKFQKYIGKNVADISENLGIDSKSKQINNLLVRGMLGLDVRGGNKEALLNIDELNKASYRIKTIQFDEKGNNKESMSFPVFKFKEIVNESWEDDDGMPSAELNITFLESTFLFVVFQKNNLGENIFKGIKFYNFPQSDIDGDIKYVWQNTVDTIKSGVKLYYFNNRVKNNFIKKSDHKIIHVRPHARKASYIKGPYSNQLPVPAIWENKPDDYSYNYMTDQCFFLNNTYVKKIVKDLLY